MKVDRQKLDMAMARACMNNADLATAVGLSRSAVHGALQGKNIRPATLGRIAKALGVDPAEIIKDES